jgi:hypothetical protein
MGDWGDPIRIVTVPAPEPIHVPDEQPTEVPV